MADGVNPNTEESEDTVDTVDSSGTAVTAVDESLREEETPDTETSAEFVDSAETDNGAEKDPGTAEDDSAQNTAGTEDALAAEDTVATTGRGWHRRVLVVAIVLLLGATGFAGWAGWSWSRAATDDSLQYAQARDAALTDGRENLAVLSSLDHRRVDEGLQRWLEVSTGPLHDRLADTSEEIKTTLREGRTVADGAVLDVGITELDEYAGTATMLAAVEITLSEEDTASAIRRNRFTAGLTRTEAGWKLSSLNQLPLNVG